MREQEETLSKTATAILWFIAVVVELVLSYALLVLNGFVAIMRGYWSFFWIFFASWGIISFAWISGMSAFISKQKRKKMAKTLQREWR